MVAELLGVTHRYGAVEALSNVRLTLSAGQVTALLGPNGAGKTTIVRLLTGLARPTAGTATLFGGNPQSVAARRQLGVMLQVARVPEVLTVREHIHLFSSYYPAPLPLPKVLEVAGLEALADRRYGQLSGGEKQRTLFALALCGNPTLLFLDEPTVGMDVESRRRFWTGVRSLVAAGRSILLTTHYLEEADALASRIIVLNRGRIVADGRRQASSTMRPIVRCAARRACRVARCRRCLASAGGRRAPGVRLLTTDADQTLRALLRQDETACNLDVRASASRTRSSH